MDKTLSIQGMTCTACAKAIEKVSKKINGVIDANVNFASEKLYLKYDENVVSKEEIINAIKKAGYMATEKEDSIDLNKEKKYKEIKTMWRNFLYSAIFAIPLLIISMGHMIGMHLPKTIDPMLNPLN